ncbi:ABC transporter permease [Microbacterium sp. SSW1-49]|uniref:ABC transporter permease n=1 Tax=Microbacterium croceum TaxID=2851645 RepID=A0ABT0FAP8_9MICO|nr:ABC transporter permease [Microbacterium croceum]MCK2035143.1 ABC transporter permease [Microbacterium croceum]
MGRATTLAGWLMPGILRRYRALVILSMIGVGVFGAVVPLASETADTAATAKEGLGSPGLRAIMLSASDPNEEQPLTGASLDEVRATDGVEEAVGWNQALLTVQHGSATISPDLTPRFLPLQPALLEGEEPVAANEVLISSAMIDDLGAEVGDTLDASYNRFVSAGLQEGVSTEVTIVGVYDATSVGLDGGIAAYGSPAWVDEVLMAQQGASETDSTRQLEYQYIYALVTSRDGVPEVVGQLTDRGFTASSLGALLSGVQPVQSALDLARIVLASLLVVFLLVVGGTAATAVMSAKRGEIGLLRAFGWPRGRVLWAFLAQFLLLGGVIAVGGALSSAVALAVLSVVFPTGLFGLPVEVGLSPGAIGTMAMLLVAPPMVFALAALVPVLTAASTPPDDVLRDIDG